MKIFTIILLMVLFCLIPQFIFAQSTKIKIKLIISSPPSIKNPLDSYVRRELRSLGDVDVDAKGANDYVLFVTALESKSKNENLLGYAVSYEFVEIIICGKEVKFELLDQGLLLGSPDDLRALSEDIVTDIDTGPLKKRRERNK